jgi:hypothetical protein
VRHYIPDTILDDYERSAQWRKDRKSMDGEYLSVPVHVNILLALIATYREARAQYDLQKSEVK